MSKVKGIATAGVTVADFTKAVEFYKKHLGFEIATQMSPTSCWGKIGSLGLYVEESPRKEASNLHKDACRISVVFDVENIESFHKELSVLGFSLDDSLTLVAPNVRWFRFKDPSGNILEACGN